MLPLPCKPNSVIGLTTEEKWSKNKLPNEIMVSGVQICALAQLVVNALKCCTLLMQLLVSEVVHVLR